MVFDKFFKKKEALIAVDVGSTAVKIMELDLRGAIPTLLNIASIPITEEVFGSNQIKKPELVAEKLTHLLESNGLAEKRAVTAVPAPGVFTKKIKMQRMAPKELAQQVQFEAGSFIPHNVDAVKIDFHVVGEAGKNQLDIIVIAAKNEVLESFTACLAYAGLETAIVDVDYFALQNCFELNYPEDVYQTVALVNIGARYSSINICRGGESLFTGDIAIGGRVITDAIASDLGCSIDKAEELKKGKGGNEQEQAAAQDVIDRKLDYIAAEFNRQISLFWNASGAEEGIQKIYIAGGGSVLKGLAQELYDKTGIAVELLDPFKAIKISAEVDPAYVTELAPVMSIAAGMALRQLGDKVIPDYDY